VPHVRIVEVEVVIDFPHFAFGFVNSETTFRAKCSFPVLGTSFSASWLWLCLKLLETRVRISMRQATQCTSIAPLAAPSLHERQPVPANEVETAMQSFKLFADTLPPRKRSERSLHHIGLTRLLMAGYKLRVNSTDY
jgi:hypothetical protein